jgi:hypothetical protein
VDDCRRQSGRRVTLSVHGKIGNIDEAHPQTIEEVVLDVDKDVALDAEGLATCRIGRARRGVQEVRRECAEAVVGTGVMHFAIESAGTQKVVKGLLTLLNGGEVGGKIRLLIHGFAIVPFVGSFRKDTLRPACCGEASTARRRPSLDQRLQPPYRTPLRRQGREAELPHGQMARRRSEGQFQQDRFQRRLGRRQGRKHPQRRHLSALRRDRLSIHRPALLRRT